MPEKGGFMDEENNLLVNLMVLKICFPEIVECLQTPNLGEKCTGCEFKNECKLISIVGYLMEKALIRAAANRFETELIN